MPRRSGKRGGARKTYYWSGNQWPATNIAAPTARTFIELVPQVVQEFMPRTLVSIRGHFNVSNSGSDATNGDVFVSAKLLYLPVDDAQTVEPDFHPTDVHAEDIARRQLWTWSGQLFKETAGVLPDSIRFEVNVKTKLKLSPAGKEILFLAFDATPTARAVTSGYLRVLLRDN